MRHKVRRKRSRKVSKLGRTTEKRLVQGTVGRKSALLVSETIERNDTLLKFSVLYPLATSPLLTVTLNLIYYLGPNLELFKLKSKTCLDYHQCADWLAGIDY